MNSSELDHESNCKQNNLSYYNLLYNKRACPTKKEPQQGFLYLTKKMSSSEKFKSNAKTSTSTGILFLFYYFLIKSYLKELLRM